jgi:hypothetical protein
MMTAHYAALLRPLRARALALVSLWASSIATGCTKFASEQDTLEAETATEPLGVDGDFSCFSQSAENGALTTAGTEPLAYALLATDFLSGSVPADLSVRGCFRPDLPCVRPATPELRPGAGGVVTVPLTVGFNGFLEITSSEMVPTLLLFPDVLSEELARLVEPVGVSLLPYSALLAFGESSQLELDPATGVISMNAYDCRGPNLAGVRLDLDTPGVPFSFIDGLPIAGIDTTSSEGTAGFANVPPGLAVVRAFRADTDELVGLETVIVRPGWVTVGSLMPQFARP